MTQFLPPNLLALFAAREPIPFLPPVDKLPYEKRTTGYSGISAFVNQFEDPSQTPEPRKIETREERRENKRKAKAELTAYKLEQDIALWSPSNNPNATTDPFKTLFVARINYDTSEQKLRREFEIYGHIKKIVIVHDVKSGKPRGYAFIEYDRERDMRSAYKHADGKKIEGRRVLVDVERGRIVKGWLPRRLGGGLGGTRLGGPDINMKHSGRTTRGEDHYMDRDRDRPERERRRSRSREKRRRSRSRSRDRHHDRPRRDRSRDRGDRAARNNIDANADKGDTSVDGLAADPEPPRKERRRSRSRDRDRKRRDRRSRSRDRDRKRRDHDRGDKDRESRRERNRQEEPEVPKVTIKEEPLDPDEMMQEQPPENFNNNNNNPEFEADYNYGNGESNNFEGY